MINDVYNKKILAYAADIPHLGRLINPDATAVAHSKLCGSKITVDLKLKDGAVTDFGHDVKACALGQASSSIMARHVVGSSAGELKALREQMYRMLKEQGSTIRQMVRVGSADTSARLQGATRLNIADIRCGG